MHRNSHFHDHQRPLNTPGVFLCFLGLLAIAFSITLRIIPSAIPTELLAILQTSPHIFDQLNAAYQYSLIACLVLSGLFVDIIGPRTVLAIAIALAVTANYFFGASTSINVLLDSRVLIGFTHPFILTGVLTMGTHWLPRRHFSLFVGLLFGTLLMVPMIDAFVMQLVQTRAAFQKAILLIDMLGIFIIISILLTERITDRTRHRHTLHGLIKPLTYYKVWLICLISMVGWMTNTFILHNGSVFLMRRYNFAMDAALSTIDTSFVYFGVGAIFMGLISDLFRKQKRYIICICYCLAALCFSILIYSSDLSPLFVPGLMYLTAFFTSSTIICYTKANDYCTIGNSGITLGLMLSVTSIGSSFFARMTGNFFQRYINDPSAASHLYMQLVLSIIPLIMIIGAIIAIYFLKPTHLHHHTKDHPTPLLDTTAKV